MEMPGTGLKCLEFSAHPTGEQAFSESEIFCGIDVVDVHLFPA